MLKAIANLTFLSAALFSVPLSAGVSLNLGECIEAHVVDGMEGNTSPGSPIELINGTHQLVVSCTVILGRSDDESFPDASDAFVLQFAAADAELTLSAPTIRSRRQLERFNSEANFRLVSSSGETVQYQADVLKKEGFQVFRDYAKELEAFNRSSAGTVRPRSSDILRVAQDANETEDKHRNPAIPDQEMAGQMLRYWYLKADMKTRNEFNRWMTSSDQPL